MFAGKEPDAGYEVSVSSVEDTNVRTVVVALAKAGNNCAQTKTTPYQIVKLPKTTLPFTHKDITATVNCK